jgi:hypothetical protein
VHGRSNRSRQRLPRHDLVDHRHPQGLKFPDASTSIDIVLLPGIALFSVKVQIAHPSGPVRASGLAALSCRRLRRLTIRLAP